MPHRTLIRRLQDTSIGLQLAVFLTIAMIPIGLIAVSQATSALRETRQLADVALVGRVTQAALEEANIFSDALTTARTLGHQILDENENLRADCDEQLKSFVENYDLYLFAGYINLDGMMTCSSSGTKLDISQSPTFKALKNNPTEIIRIVQQGSVTNQNVIVGTQPIERNGVIYGFVSISIPIEVVRLATRTGEEVRNYHVALVDREGTVFSSNTPERVTAEWLPMEVNLKSLEALEETVFDAKAGSGQMRTYAFTPIFERQIFAIATSIREDPIALTGTRYLSFYLFPVAMWAIGLLVSLLAVHRLIIRHITSLRNKMLAFEAGERNISDLSLSKSPGELAELGNSFSRMIATIAHDEVIQEAALKEKNVLLREVYHRVKNNLQLILSIMSMQSRNAHSAEAKSELARLQNRVMSIATIHQMLYTAPELRAARADGFLDEIARNLVAAGAGNEKVVLDMEVEPVKLTPDQAVPLSLYLSEGITNALKHAVAGRDNGRIGVSLKRDESEAILRITNSIAPLPDGVTKPDSGGLGSRLMSAFVGQLNATETREETKTEYIVSLRFPLETSLQETVDTPQEALILS